MRASSSFFKGAGKLRDWNLLVLPPSSSSSAAATLFHSSAISFASRSSKDGGGSDEPKTRIRFSVHQKRADAKGALKNLLLNGASSKQHFQGEDNSCYGDRKNGRKTKEGSFHESEKIQRSKKSGKLKHHNLLNNGKVKHHKKQSWHDFSDDHDYDPSKAKLSASLGGRRSFTWSFGSGEGLHFESATPEFEWRDDSHQTKTRRKVWNESDVEDESSDTSLHSHRASLGLPLAGPLTLDGIKSAFHESALKWHPDKHPGSSQTIAAEKFKLCVDAYNNLRNSMKSR